MNSDLLKERLHQQYGIETPSLETKDSVISLTNGVLSSDWSKQKDILLVVQNPSA
jgi:hypothetical protein